MDIFGFFGEKDKSNLNTTAFVLKWPNFQHQKKINDQHHTRKRFSTISIFQRLEGFMGILPWIFPHFLFFIDFFRSQRLTRFSCYFCLTIFPSPIEKDLLSKDKILRLYSTFPSIVSSGYLEFEEFRHMLNILTDFGLVVGREFLKTIYN